MSEPPNHHQETSASRAGVSFGLLAKLGAALCGVTLALGLTQPFVMIVRFGLFSDAHAILNLPLVLIEEEDYLLALVVAVFVVLNPIAKTLLIIGAAFTRGATLRWLVPIEKLGKWSMLDVFVVAILIVALKSSWFLRVDLQPGLYFFLAHVVVSLVSVGLLRRMTRAPSPA